jgi:nitroreductase
MEHLALAAAEQGLGTCWIGGGFEEPVVKEALRLPPAIRVVALTPLGYPDEVTKPQPRKTMEAMARRRYGKGSPFPFPSLARASYSTTR